MRPAFVCLGSALLAVISSGAVLSEPFILDSASEAYAYATASDSTTVLEAEAVVVGSAAANDEVRLKGHSHVTGDVRTTGVILGDGLVDGLRLEGAEPVALPAIPPIEELRDQADRVIQGPWNEAADQVIDDFVFVDGNVHFRGTVSGTGTLVASGDVRFDGPGTTGPDSYLSLIALGDVRFSMERTFRGVVRATRDIDLEMAVSIEGVLIAGRNVHLKRNSAVTWLPPDRDAPVLELESPLPLQFIDRNTIQPEIILRYEDAGSGIDQDSIILYWDDVEITVLCDTFADSVQCLLPNQYAGIYRLRVEISDLAGNTTSQEFEIEYRRDDEAPTLVVTSPQNEALVNTPMIEVTGSVFDEGGIQLVRVEGTLVQPDANGAFTTQVALEEGYNTIYVAAKDIFDRLASEFRNVTLDTVPPTLDVTQPTPGVVTTNSDVIRIRGEVDDDIEFDRVELDGVPLALEYERFFRAEIEVPPQGRTVTLTAFDRAGSQTSELFDIRRYTLPNVSIESPVDGQRVDTASVSISGSVSADVTQVTVNGSEATLTGGVFVSQPVAIGAGRIIEAVATTESGLQAVDVIRLTRDVAPPAVTILDPPPGAQIFGTSAAVFGLVRDAGIAAPSENNMTVRVNGILAEVRNGSFFVPAVPVSTGTQSISAVATDAAGRSGTTTVTVEVEMPAGAGISKTSGDLQSGKIGESLADPLAVRVSARDGQPHEGATVVFRVVRGNGELEEGQRQLATTTDASGTATVPFRLGTRAGVGNHVVEVSSPGLAPQRFHTSASAGDAAGIYVDSGDQQAGIAGRKLPHPLVVAVTDAGFNRLEGVPVTFRVARGSGSFPDGSAELVALTNSDGIAAVDLITGIEDGIVNNVVDAFLEDHPDRLFVAFGASAKAGGPSSDTTISGVVLDNSDQPMPGVEIHLKGHPNHTTTGLDGTFHIENAPVGALLMEIEGATTSRPGQWPHLEFELTTVPGRDNTVGMPIYLVELDASMGVDVSETEGGRIEVPSLPGFALDIAPGSVTFPDGSRSGRVFVSQVHADKVPMVPNFGQQPKFVLTIQPGGAHFDPPARMSLPNTDGLAPGEITEMYSFDHDLGRFVGIGTASVTEDATQVVSDVGSGVIKAGWHCGGNPSARGTTYDCPECQICDGSKCVPGCALSGVDSFAKPLDFGLMGKAGCQDCQDTQCRKNSRCSGSGCIGEQPQIESLAIRQANGEPVDDVIYENSSTPAEFLAEVEPGNCDFVSLSWDLTAENPVTGAQYRRTGDGVNPFRVTLPFEARYAVALKASCGGCNSKRASESFLAHRLFVDFEISEEDIEISDDGEYTENAPVKVKVISSVTEEVATSYSEAIQIFEDETGIYSQNGGSLPERIDIENGLGRFCAKSRSEGTIGGTSPLTAILRTVELPTLEETLSIPQWVTWKAIDPERGGNTHFDWAEALNADILRSATADLSIAAQSAGGVEFEFVSGALGAVFPGRGPGTDYTINVYFPGLRLNRMHFGPCAFPASPAFTQAVAHEVRHTYQNATLARTNLGSSELEGRPQNDDDLDFLPEEIDLAPTNIFVDTPMPRSVCVYWNLNQPWEHDVTYLGDTVPDPESRAEDPTERPADITWARETDATEFAHIHANTVQLEPRENPDISSICRE